MGRAMSRVLVLGLGAMGSATVSHLAERGHEVVGFDRFDPPHTQGSSHGQTRIIRQSYWEDPRYVPLLFRAYELWRKLEADTGRSLMQLTGGLMIGKPDGRLVAGSRLSAETYGLPHQILSARELMRRHPAFAVDADVVALWEEAAGYLAPEACIEAYLERAAMLGAELHANEQVLDWQVTPGGGVALRTERATYEGDHLVVTAGPWTGEILRELQLPLTVTRQVLYWFAPTERREWFFADKLPIYIVEGDAIGAGEAQPPLYGFPLTAPGFEGAKVALHGSSVRCTPDTMDRTVREQEIAAMRDRLATALPRLSGRLVHAETCLYTMTPDENFLVGTLPSAPQVTLAAGFSGHGFKFASVIGEILADLSTGQAPGFDLRLFALERRMPKALVSS